MARLILGLALTLGLGGALWNVAGNAADRVLSPAALANVSAPAGHLARGAISESLAAEAPAASGRLVAVSAAPASVPAERHDDQSATGTLEGEVARAWSLASQGRGTEADAVLSALLAQVPQFRPALTLQGLLHAGWNQPAADAEDTETPPPRLQPPSDLADESSLRIGTRQRVASHRQLLPANLLQVSPQVHTVLAADMSESRLYLLRRDEHGLAVVADFYLSTGMRGSFKQNPGDQRTPVGIYSLLPRLGASQLPALAGHGAWPLSFPNRWDQWQGHLGSGIWLHGTAPGKYDGLPHSTNGCLAVSNDDLDQLAPLLAEGATVLVVSDHLDWVSPAVLEQRRTQAIQRLAAHGGSARRPQGDDSLYAYPGAPSLLLIRRADGGSQGRDEFWPDGALEPLAALRAGTAARGGSL